MILLNDYGMIKKAIKIVVTGSGALSKSFESLAAKHPTALEFYGVVDEEQLYQLIESVDVIINPHEVNYGVMPFKLMEAVATGRLVVSTKCVPVTARDVDVEWLESIQFCERSVEAFLDTLSRACVLYGQRKGLIEAAVGMINAKYSRDEVKKKINLIFD